MNQINNTAYTLLAAILEKRTGVPNALASGSLYDGLGPRQPDNIRGETSAGVHVLCKRLEGWFEWQGVECKLMACKLGKTSFQIRDGLRLKTHQVRFYLNPKKRLAAQPSKVAMMRKRETND